MLKMNDLISFFLTVVGLGCSASCAASNEIVLEDTKSNGEFTSLLNDVFQNASVITIRYLSKNRTYPSEVLDLDLDKYWNFELKSNCVGSCLKSEEWLYHFLSESLPSSECTAMLSTYVEFELPERENFRIYTDHGGHCIYVPHANNTFFSKRRFNDAIKSAWGNQLRGM